MINRKIKKIVVEKEKKNSRKTFYKKVQQIAETLKTEIDTEKSASRKNQHKKEVKEKVILKVIKEND